MIELNQSDNKNTKRMKKAKYIVGLIFCFGIGYLLAAFTRPVIISPILSTSIIKSLFFQKEDRQNSQTKISDITQENEDQQPQHIVDIPAKYFDPREKIKFDDVIMLGGIKVVYPPVALKTPTDIELTNKEFKLTDELIQQAAGLSPNDWIDIDNDGIKEHDFEYSEPIDVDNDGKKEEILYAWTASNHPPHKVYVIKDEKIIYHSKGRGRANISLSESESHNGFYIWETTGETPLFGVGAYKLTRFIYEDGKFIPVWYQKTFDLQTTKP